MSQLRYCLTDVLRRLNKEVHLTLLRCRRNLGRRVPTRQLEVENASMMCDASIIRLAIRADHTQRRKVHMAIRPFEYLTSHRRLGLYE